MTNIVWTGREYQSIENCHIEMTNNAIIVTSTILGYYQGVIYKVEYCIKTNKNWETLLFRIKSEQNDRDRLINFEGDGLGNWYNHGEKLEEFKGCIDIDIPLTPFTNSLPINRLALMDDDQRQIDVIYLDLLNNQIERVKQKYRRLSPTEYHYENVPNDFEAVIKVDDFGFVLDYRSLFVRTAANMYS